MAETFLAYNYTNRTDLENDIVRRVSSNIEANRLAGHLIKGTKSELKSLGLSEKVEKKG